MCQFADKKKIILFCVFQRYFINDTFYTDSTGPVFLMIGGEGPADPRWVAKGTWIDYAKEFGAFCIQLEHRFYGESRPTR